MSVDLTKGIVRIVLNGATAGTGFLVSEAGLIATCSHVLQSEGSQRNGDPRPEFVDVVFAGESVPRREDGLAELIGEDASRMKYPLPLLEFTLAQLWEKRNEGFLTHDGYRSIGRVAGALSQWAADTYHSLSDCERAIARRVFTRLIHYGSAELPDTGQTLAIQELVSTANEEQATRLVVKKLADARLLLTDMDRETRKETVEIIHESLRREWNELDGWIKQEREFLIWRQRLRQWLHEWEQSGCDDGALLRGVQLAEASSWLSQQSMDLGDGERSYIEAGQRAELGEQQRWKELYQQAERERNEAHRQRRLAVARHLAVQAELLNRDEPDLLERSTLLAIESMQRLHLFENDRMLRQLLALLPKRVIDFANPEGAVNSVSFSPDGRYLAIATTGWKGGGLARIIDRVSGEDVCRLSHSSGVEAVVFSPDGSLFVTGGYDNPARVFLSPEGKEVSRLMHEGVRAMAFSPNGKCVAAGCNDGTTHVFEAWSGKPVSKLRRGEYAACVAFSPNGHYVVTTALWDNALMFEAATGKELFQLGPKDTVTSLAFSNDGHHLTTGTAGGIVLLFEAESGKQLWARYQGYVKSVAFSSDGGYVAAGAGNSARIFDVNTGEEVSRLSHKNSVNEVAFSPDGLYLATASQDRTARVFEVLGGKEVSRLSHENNVSSVAFTPDSRYVATGGGDTVGLARIFEPSKWPEMSRWTCNGGPLSQVGFSQDEHFVATCQFEGEGREDIVRVFEMQTGSQVSRWQHERLLGCVAISPNSRYVAAGGMCETVGIYGLRDGKQIARLPHDSFVFTLAFSPDSRYLATGGSGAAVRLFEISNGDEAWYVKHRTTVDSVMFSSDGRFLATGDRINIVRIFDVLTGNIVMQLGKESEFQSGVNALAFSPDGGYLAMGAAETVHVFRLADRKDVLRLDRLGALTEVVFSHDGRLLATGSYDETTRVFDVSSGRQVSRFVHRSKVSAVMFNANDDYLITATIVSPLKDVYQIVIDRHPLQATDLIREARLRLTRNLTADEWRNYVGDEPYSKIWADLP